MTTLQILRKQKGWLQVRVASEADISREYLSALENGRQKLTRQMAEKLADIYGVSPMELLGYQMPETLRSLKDERDSVLTEVDRLRKEHAQQIQTLQAENDALKDQIKSLRHELDFAQSVCKMLMKNNNSQPKAEPDEENV